MRDACECGFAWWEHQASASEHAHAAWHDQWSSGVMINAGEHAAIDQPTLIYDANVGGIT